MGNCPGKELARRGLLELDRGLLVQDFEGFPKLGSRVGRVDGERAPRLGELAEFGLHNNGQVSIIRHFQAQRALQLDLPGRALQQVGAPHNIADTLRGVIHNNSELVCERPVAPPDHRIAEGAQVELAGALDPVYP